MLAKIAEKMARHFKVPLENLTLKMIREAPTYILPVRYKKLLQGRTTGEARIKPANMSSVNTAVQEVKAFGTGAGGGMAVGLGLADAIFSSFKSKPKRKFGITPSETRRQQNQTSTPKKKPSYSGGQRKTTPTASPKKIRPKLRPESVEKSSAPRTSLRPKLRPKK